MGSGRATTLLKPCWDVACRSPRHERYTHLVGVRIALPRTNRTIPISPMLFDPKFGTAAENHPAHFSTTLNRPPKLADRIFRSTRK